MADRETVKQGITACWSKFYFHSCCDCPYMINRDDEKCVERLGTDAIELIEEQEAEIRQLRLALGIAKGECKGIRVEGR